jgi:DNA-directed RNA polymerase subunit RPC12/RpoP
MQKYIHIWKVHCSKCGKDFQHIFRARDMLKPHVFNDLLMKCPYCGNTSFDTVSSAGKLTEQEWKEEHPELEIDQLPDYSYSDTA